MQRRVSQISGDYGLNIINTLIDYKGDVARNNTSSSQIVYSPDFSPNNIRRLILSADGARIDFHVSVDGKLSKTKPFSDNEKMNLLSCLMLPDYKPMIWALADRVCSSIEEVIICTNNSVGADLSRELNFEGLLRNRIGNISDVKQAVSTRYRRLAYFTIVNCDIGTLVKNQEVMSCNSPMKLISETDFVKSNGSITVFKKDWYNYYGSTSAYSLDNSGSRLNEHFKKVKSDVEESKKKNAVDAIKSERLKGVSDKFEKAFKNYRGIYTCVKNLSVIIAKEGKNYISLDVDNLSLSLQNSPDKVKEEFNELNSTSSCDEFVKNLIISSSNLYSQLAEWFFSSLIKVKSSYPLSLDILLSGVDRRITVPPNCEKIVQGLEHDFKGVSLSDSTSNICSYSCILFVTDVGEHNMSKYYDKSTWLKYFEGGNK